MQKPSIPISGDTLSGFFFAFSAYFLWGFLPIYMKMLAHFPSAEIVAHRVIWSVPIAGILLILMGRTKDVRAAILNPKTLAMGCLTASLITINWGIYVWRFRQIGHWTLPLVITSTRCSVLALGQFFCVNQLRGPKWLRLPWRLSR